MPVNPLEIQKSQKCWRKKVYPHGQRKIKALDSAKVDVFMRQLIRYGLVGVASNAAMYFAYLSVTYVGVEPKAAMTLLYFVGASIGFIGNRKWTFSHRGNPASAVVRYILAHAFGYMLNLLILVTFVDRLGYPHQWVQGAAIIVVAVFLFIIFKYFVFREQRRGIVKDMTIGFKPDYFKEFAELEAGNFWFCTRNRLILWALRKFCPGLKSFLEIGCGTGFVLSAISRQFPEARLLGGEYWEEGLVYARRRVPCAEFTQMDARHIPYVSELDAVGAFDVLEHIEEDEIVLRQICMALKPGGYLFVTVPQHRWPWSAVDEFACHVRRYNANEIERKILGARFELIRSTSFVSLPLPAMYLSRLPRRNTRIVSMDAVAGGRMNPTINKIFEWLLNIDLALIRIGIDLPVGGSRLLIARKPALIQTESKI